MKIVSIVGARPQFIKLAPFNAKIRKKHKHIIIHTGQHYDYEMSKAFFDQLKISEPDFNLEIGSGSHAWQTGQMLTKLGKTLEEVEPDLVIVYGDTNSTLAGALAAVKLHIPVGHVESGYRSGDISMPEEVNRIITDRISQFLFAPTKNAVQNLLHEGLPKRQIFFVGNIMAESLLQNLAKIKNTQILEKLHLKPKTYAALTVHRPENTNNKKRLASIIKSLMKINFPIVFPAHPRALNLLKKYNLIKSISSSNINLIPPLKYLEFLKLESDAKCIITDSGGIQEEALIFSAPCITLRYNTERVETLEAGANVLAGADPKLITKGINRQITLKTKKWKNPPRWDKNVAKRIVEAIEGHPELINIGPQTHL